MFLLIIILLLLISPLVISQIVKNQFIKVIDNLNQSTQFTNYNKIHYAVQNYKSGWV